MLMEYPVLTVVVATKCKNPRGISAVGVSGRRFSCRPIGTTFRHTGVNSRDMI